MKSIFKEGDKVIVVSSTAHYYSVGDIGVVYGVYDGDTDEPTVWANFSNQGNPEVLDDGRWCVQSGGKCDMKVILTDEEIRATLKDAVEKKLDYHYVVSLDDCWFNVATSGNPSVDDIETVERGYTMKEVYLTDLQEAEANVIRLHNKFLRERGWIEQYNPHKTFLVWSKKFYMENSPLTVKTTAEHLTTDEAIEVEKVYGNKQLFKDENQ